MKTITKFAATLAASFSLMFVVAPAAHADDPAPSDPSPTDPIPEVPETCERDPLLPPSCDNGAPQAGPYDRLVCLDDDGDGSYVTFEVLSNADWEYVTGTRYYDYPQPATETDTLDPAACSVYDVPGGYDQPSTPTEPVTDEPATPVKHPVLVQERVCKAKVFRNHSTRIRCADTKVSHLAVTGTRHARGHHLVAQLNNGSTWKLAPCRQEDSQRCFWNAQRMGNHFGHSFVSLYGQVLRY